MFVNKDEGQNLLVIGAPEHDANAYHLSGFLAPDAVICLRVAGKRYLAVSSLEYGRAEKRRPWTSYSPTRSWESAVSPAS